MKLALVVCALLFILSGCVIMIDPELDNPYEITLSGVRELLPYGEEMTVTATVADEFGKKVRPDRYEWFLRGSPLAEESDTITLGSDLETGLYELDLIVTKDGVPSSQGASFEVVENP